MNIAQGIDSILEQIHNFKYIKILHNIRLAASFIRMVSGFSNALISWIIGDTEGAILGLINGFIGFAELYGICELQFVVQCLIKGMAVYDIYSRSGKSMEAIENGDMKAIAWHSAMIAMDCWTLTSTCFDGDTLIATEEGQKRIDEIEVGDRVWAYNVETGKLELKEVLTVYIKENDEILHLKTIEGDIEGVRAEHSSLANPGGIWGGEFNLI